MVWDAIGYKSRSPLVHIEGALNCARYISRVLRHVALNFIQSFSRIMHDRMLLVLYEPYLLRKYSAVSLACTFTRSLTNRKRLAHGCRATGSSPYVSHYV
ncbi:hypothetical protein TNCV_157781 [Trichonephila clavipes]|nr:hypothetical protein TNCV_157781 [Trichonephila clavipes]